MPQTFRSSKLYRIIKGILWREQKDPKQCKVMIYKAYFKPQPIYNAETWAPSERNKSNDMK
jgi:hypothetical protein